MHGMVGPGSCCVVSCTYLDWHAVMQAYQTVTQKIRRQILLQVLDIVVRHAAQKSTVTRRSFTTELGLSNVEESYPDEGRIQSEMLYDGTTLQLEKRSI